jgi:membrane-associated phospholipid phosphatase
MAISLTPPKSALYDPQAMLASAALAAFLVLAAIAVASERTPGDVWLTNQVQSVDYAAFSRALDITEDAAQFPVYLIALAVASFLFLAWGGTRPVGTLAAVPFLALLVPLLKISIGRPRPDASLVDVVFPQPDSMSFPSGHAFTAVLVYGLIFCLAAAYIPVRWLRIAVQATCAWVIVLTCVERVYVGHHWPSDVAGGILLGALVLAAVVTIERRTAHTAPRGDAAEPAPLAPRRASRLT